MSDRTPRLYTVHKCSRCGKKFTIPIWVDYTYKLGEKYQCSYHCYSEAIDEYNMKRYTRR